MTNQYIYFKINTVQFHLLLGRSKGRLNISSILKDGSDIRNVQTVHVPLPVAKVVNMKRNHQ